MQTIVTELYGILGMFFTTDVRYEPPRTAINYPDPSSSEASSSESEEDGLPIPAADQAVRAEYAAERPARAAAREARNERQRRNNDRYAKRRAQTEARRLP